NTNPYTFFGNRPLNLAPEATLERGLASVTVRTMAFTRFLPAIASALGRGKLRRRSRWVDHRTDVECLTVRAYGPVPYQVDGDHLGDADVLEFQTEPGGLVLVLP